MSARNRSTSLRPRRAKAYLLSLGVPLLALASFSCSMQVAGPAKTGPATTGSGPDDPKAEPDVQTELDGGFVTPDPAAKGASKDGDDDASSKKDKKKSGGGLPGAELPEDEEAGEAEPGEDESEEQAPGPGPGKPSEILAEADVVHVEGDTVYALSRFSGLHIFDFKDPANIRTLASKKLEGEPFEMYVRGQEVLVMVRDRYFYDPGAKRWETSSAVVRLSTKKAGEIALIDETRVLGRISDSRMVDKVLYLVAHESRDCFECDGKPKVRLSSVKVESGATIEKIDDEIFDPGQRFWGMPSAYFGQEQIYVALPRRSESEGEKGQLHRALYNKATGKLEALKPIMVDGRVQSRWQMNEKGDVLRVFSQQIRRDIPPKLETFSIKDNKGEAIAAIDVKLPRPEELKSARFDGDRGYLITFRRTDPLFTFDLSDPEKPKQLGELEIPGWVYHMEPKGDRLLGVGYNARGEKDRLSLTLFDVSTLSEPKVLSRVNFGGDSAEFAERQDQIHKSIKMLKDEKMILVPYLAGRRDDGNFPGDDEPSFDEESAVEPSEDIDETEDTEDTGYAKRGVDCGGSARSAIQIFDWEESKVTRRGVAPIKGGAHRSFLHKKRLIALSDEAVAAYNIDDRDKPALLDSERVSVNAARLLRMGDHSIRISEGWWGDARTLEVVKHDAVDKAASVASISLGELYEKACSDGRDVHVRELFAHQDKLYVLFDSWRSGGKPRVSVLDLGDPSKPKVLGSVAVERPRGRPTNRLGAMLVESNLFGALKDRVILASLKHDYDEEEERSSLKTIFTILRLDPAKGLIKEGELERKGAHYSGGLIEAGEEAGSWHARKTDKPGQLKFYYDRFYIDAGGVFRHQAINVPGAPLGRDSQSKRLMTMDFALEDSALDPVSCQAHVKYFEWDWENSRCILLKTALTQLELPEGAPAKKLDATDIIGPEFAQRSAFFHADRVFGTGRPAKDKFGSVHVVAGLDPAGSLKSTLLKRNDNKGRIQPINGPRVMERISRHELKVLDARDLNKVVEHSYELPHRWCSDVHADAQELQCAMGRYGVSRLAPKP